MTDLDLLPKGRAWEYRVHRAAFLAGWYVRRGVNLRERVAGAPQTMGEIDILGLDFGVGLVPRLLLGECKDRKGGAKEADRVVWLLGVRQVLRGQQILFAKPTITEATYTWARSFDVLLWDEAAIQAVEARYGLPPDTAYAGSFNATFVEDVLVPARKLGAAHANLRRAWDYLSSGFWYSPAAARAKRLPSYFEVASSAEGIADVAKDSFVAEGLIALLVAALEIGGQLARVSPARAHVWVADTFASGVASATALRDVAARADDYYRDALTKSTRASVGAARPIDVPRLVDHIAQPPVWLADFLELAKRLVERPQYANDLLRFADMVLFEELLAERVPPPAVLESIASPADELRRLVQLAGYFAKRVWGVEARVIDRLLASNGTPSATDPRDDVAEQMSLVDTAAKRRRRSE